ncbi:MAG: ATP-binding protein [Planctomycetota bacterium]|nr:ATP-binding protein [Planctomycetota bacterium]
MPDGLPLALQIDLPADLVYVRPLRKMVEGLLYAQGWDEDNVDDAALIVTEVVQNAVEHGSRGDGAETVRVSLHVLPDGLDLDVVDPGSGRDPRVAVDRDVLAPVPMDQARGRGLFLIHRLSVKFVRAVDGSGGLRVHVRKEIDA